MLHSNIDDKGGDIMFLNVNKVIKAKEIKDTFCDYCLFCDYPMDSCNCDTFFDD